MAAAGSSKAGSRPAGRSLTLAAMLTLVCAALLLRLPGYEGRPLWNDELWRANLILDPAFWHDYFFAPSVGSAITSLAYAVVVKCLGLFGPDPDILRLSSLIPGVLAGLVAFFLTRKAGGGLALALVAGLIFAFNPNFISYSKEMKPYMFEVLVHMAGLYAWFVMLQIPRPNIRAWLLYFFVLLFAVFSTPTAIFMLPAAGLTLFVRFLMDGAHKNVRNSNLAACTAVFTIIGVVVAALYYFVWRHGSNDDMLSIWADGFSQSGNYLRFLVSALMQMWRQAFNTGVGLPRQAELALAIFGGVLVWIFVNRKALAAPIRYFLFFYSVLGATVCFLNFMNIWPLGAMRVNLFLYAYLVMLLFVLAAQLPVSNIVARLCLLGVCLLLVWSLHSAASRAHYRNLAVNRLSILGAPIERSDLVIEDFSPSGPVGRAILADCPKQKTLVIADGYMSSAVSYYTKYDVPHRQGAALLEGPCVRYAKYTEAYLHPDDTNSALEKLLPGVSHAWFIHMHLGDSEVAAIRGIAERYGHVTHMKSYEGAGYFELALPRSDPGNQPAAPTAPQAR